MIHVFIQWKQNDDESLQHSCDFTFGGSLAEMICFQFPLQSSLFSHFNRPNIAIVSLHRLLVTDTSNKLMLCNLCNESGKYVIHICNG